MGALQTDQSAGVPIVDFDKRAVTLTCNDIEPIVWIIEGEFLV